jgi:hypothetical protein
VGLSLRDGRCPGAERCEPVATTIAQEHTDRQPGSSTTRRLPRAPCISHPKGLLRSSREVVVAQLPLELILVRQLAYGPGGSRPSWSMLRADLVFVNEAAGSPARARFRGCGPSVFADWTTAFASRTKGRQRADPATHPLAIAIRQRRPVHGPLRIVGRDGVLRSLVVTALPLEGSRGQLLGGLAMFWEPPTR